MQKKFDDENFKPITLPQQSNQCFCRKFLYHEVYINFQINSAEVYHKNATA